jgi:hypothetical protein
LLISCTYWRRKFPKGFASVSERAKRMGAFFSPLNRSRWGYRSQTNKNALSRILTHLLFHIILKCRVVAAARAARQYLPALKFFSNISNRLLRRRKHIKIYIYSHRAKVRHICALGIRRAVCLDSFFRTLVATEALDGGALK